MLPDLHRAVEACLAGADRRAVARAARALSETYRADAGHPLARMDDAVTRLAYLATRLPATVAALAFVVRRAAACLDLSACATVLELGAGPGPAAWACAPVMPALRQVHMVDRDAGLLDLGRRLADHAGVFHGVTLSRTTAGIERLDPMPEADVVVLSYAIGEVDPERRASVLARAWAAARLVLIVVEPGTRPGFARVLDARAMAIAAGGHVAAPCPHDAVCPMVAPDWCHVPVQLDRSRLHQQVKGASRGFEDEKIAYVVVGRAAPPPVRAARVIAHPDTHSGHLRLRLCTPEGIQTRTRSKRDGEAYRRARHARWGDALAE